RTRWPTRCRCSPPSRRRSRSRRWRGRRRERRRDDRRAPRRGGRGGAAMSRALSPLPLAEWRPTRDRLHRWARLAGAVRRQCSPHRKHWWHIGLVPSPRGLTTTPFGTPHGCAELELDLHRGELRLTADDAREQHVSLAKDPAGDGREDLIAALAAL